ncbi:putative ATP-dependent RNA helicase like protein [Verticillium longisporum]|nr:putative ATP-dependent RNA helicase like protein [Verticillium longisporum]
MVARFVDEIKAEKVICLTATATPVVADDICNAFSISKDGVFRTSPYRPNLRLEAVATSKQEEKRDLLLAYLKKHKGSTLVYVTQQRQAEDLALDLKKQGFKVQAFHAGMKTEEKTRIQDAFMASKVDIVVATIAFGMGIDKSDIRSIIHWDLSNTVEEYCQQVGRAGRDGKESHCMLYLCPEDFYVKEAFARGDLPSRQSLRGLLKDIFSPEVLIARFVDEIKAEKVICLTATATPVVADDICNAFSISKDGVFRTSPYRPNLRLEAVAISKQEEKRDLLLAYLKKHKGSTLVYVTQQRQAEDLALELRKQGFKVQAFHAGMKTEEKTRIQDAFMASKVDIVVATIAFGMGIDKSDIRSIIHWDLSNTVEEYCQQVGRAGRDGKESHCMLYLCPEDLYVKEAFARGDLPSRQSLRGLLKDIFRPEVLSLSVGDTFKTSHHPQTTEFDIRMSPLSIIYAALELRFKLIRAITPEYSSYTFEANNVYYPRLKNDKSPEAAAILNNAKKAKKYHSIDPTAVSKSTGIRRNDLIKYLNMLNDTGCIKLKVSGVQNKKSTRT